MPFVLDASTTACWAFQDEQHPDADAALERMRTDQAIAPSLWWFEIRNILIVNERRKRLSEADTAAFLRDLAVFSVEIDITPETDEVLRLDVPRIVETAMERQIIERHSGIPDREDGRIAVVESGLKCAAGDPRENGEAPVLEIEVVGVCSRAHEPLARRTIGISSHLCHRDSPEGIGDSEFIDDRRIRRDRGHHGTLAAA